MAWSIFDYPNGNQVAVTWAHNLLTAIGAPVTPGNLTFVYQWEKSEGGGGKFNPLNQGPVPGNPSLTSTGQQYGGGAADFVSWQAGITGAKDYLNMPNFEQVRNQLRANNPVGARSALWSSPWASSHYGYGSNWSNVTAPGQGKPLPPGGGPVSGGGGNSLTGFDPVGSLVSGILKALGLGSAKDMFIRLGLILLGGSLVIVGIAMLTGKAAAQTAITVAIPEAKAAQGATGTAKGAAKTAAAVSSSA